MVGKDNVWEGTVKGVAHAAATAQVNSLSVRLRNSCFFANATNIQLFMGNRTVLEK